MVILYLMGIVYPLFYIPWVYNYYYYPRFILLMVLGILAVLHLLFKYKTFEWGKLKGLPGKWWLLGFFVLLSLSTLFSPYINIAYFGEFQRDTGYLTYLFTFILFVYSYLTLTEKRLHRLLKAMVMTASIVALYGIFQYYGFQPHFYKNQQLYYGTRSSSTIGNPNFLGTYLYIMFVLSCYLYLKEKHWVYLLTNAIIYACMITTLTRSAWLASFIIFMIIGLMNFKKRRFWMLCATLAMVSSLLFLSNHNFTNRIEASTITVAQITDNKVAPGRFGSNRGYIWAHAIHRFEHSSLKEYVLGTGPDTFYQSVKYKPLPNVKADKAHNIFLETLLTIGIPGFICLYMFYFQLLSFKKTSLTQRYLSLLLIGYLVQGFFNIDVVSVYPLFVILLGSVRRG